MANALVGNLYKHRTYGYQNPQVGINTRFFFVTTIAGSPQTEQSLVTALDAIIAPLYKPMMTASANYLGSDMQFVNGAPPYPIQLSTQANLGAGTAGTTPLPAQVSGIYSTFTGETGRGYRGRAYIFFPDQVHVAVGPPPVPKTAYITLLSNLIAAVTGVINVTVGPATYTLQWVIRHQSPPAVAGTTTDILNGTARGAWATQKRRGDYGRPNALPAL